MSHDTTTTPEPGTPDSADQRPGGRHSRTDTTVPGRVTFVVPTKNSARTLEACLRTVADQADADVELIVVDNHSTDKTPEIAARYADMTLTLGPERCAQRNAGADAATGEFVVFIDADMRLDPRVAAQVVEQFNRNERLAALVVPELAFGEGFWAQCRGLEKELYLGDAAVEAARAFRTAQFLDDGGWSLTLTAGEDWELTDRVVAAHSTPGTTDALGRISAFVHHDEGHLRLGETFTKKRYYGQWIPQYLADGGGTATRRLRRTSLFQPARLAAQPHLAAGLVVLKGAEAAGLYLGMRDGRRR